MDWNAIAAWAEVAGAVAVVISLVYLAAQIRHGNAVAKAAGQESVVNAFRNFTQPIAQDPELYRLFHQGVEEFDSLEGDDRGRFFHLAFQFGKVFESAHFHYTRGLLDQGRGWAGELGWRTMLTHRDGRSIGRCAQISILLSSASSSPRCRHPRFVLLRR